MARPDLVSIETVSGGQSRTQTSIYDVDLGLFLTRYCEFNFFEFGFF